MANKEFVDTESIFDSDCDGNDFDVGLSGTNNEKKDIVLEEKKHEIPESKKEEIKKNNNNETKKNENSNKKTRKTINKLFTISQKNIKVLEILKNLGKGRDSDYICQAIIEKYNNDNNSKHDNEKNTLKQEIKDVLEELVGTKYIILKTSNNTNFVVPNIDFVDKETTTDIEENEEKNKLLLNLSEMMDDDDDD